AIARRTAMKSRRQSGSRETMSKRLRRSATQIVHNCLCADRMPRRPGRKKKFGNPARAVDPVRRPRDFECKRPGEFEIQDKPERCAAQPRRVRRPCPPEAISRTGGTLMKA